MHEPTTAPVCEACQSSTATERIVDDEELEPYSLCPACAGRLQNLSLRPLEWFNLIARHGETYLLCSSFYEEDGAAWHHRAVVEDTDSFPAPDLAQAGRSAHRLVDYCISRQECGAAESALLRSFGSAAILSELEARAATRNPRLMQVLLIICACAVGPDGAAWVRGQAGRAATDDILSAWAQAAAACLPHEEGLRITMAAVEATPPRERARQAMALLWFRSPAVLDWIEAHVPPSTILAEWGRLAALSGLSWQRVEAWLASGRPMSLVALDALVQFISRPNLAPIINMLQPVLADAPGAASVARALRQTAEADPSPRVTQLTDALIANLSELRGLDRAG